MAWELLLMDGCVKGDPFKVALGFWPPLVRGGEVSPLPSLVRYMEPLPMGGHEWNTLQGTCIVSEGRRQFHTHTHAR